MNPETVAAQELANYRDLRSSATAAPWHCAAWGHRLGMISPTIYGSFGYPDYPVDILGYPILNLLTRAIQCPILPSDLVKGQTAEMEKHH